MKNITLEELLEAGCHFGHKAERWHPKADEYIYAKKDGIHIIDLAKTKEGIIKAQEYIKDLISKGGEVVFVGTKRQARGIIKQECEKAGAPFFVERWIGGFLTNWDEIQKNTKRANDMSQEKKDNLWQKYPKHEQVRLDRQLNRLNMYYGGVLNVKKAPDVLVIVDTKKEHAAVKEAFKLDLDIVGIIDTNSDPRRIKYVIPANDDAVGSIKLIISALTEAYGEGKVIYKKGLAQKEKTEKKEAKKETKAVEDGKLNEKSEKTRSAVKISQPVGKLKEDSKTKKEKK